MALHLSLDLQDSTFADLAALVEAGRTAGIPADTRVSVNDGVLAITTDGDPAHARGPRERAESFGRPAPSAGSDAALKFIAELLGGPERGGRH